MGLFFYILGTLMGIFIAYLGIPHPLKEILFRSGKQKQDDLPLLQAIIIFLLIIESICWSLIINTLIKSLYHEYL